MSWNHRVVQHAGTKNSDQYFAIHEVFYDQDGKPNGVTKEPVAVIATDDDTESTPLENLRWTLTKMMECLDKPILDYEEIGL